MKRLFLLLFGALALVNSQAQFVHKIKADSVLITNDSCTAELNLENSTKHIKGFLYNKGNGRTEFRKAGVLNDSTFVFGEDTLVIRGSGGSAWKLAGNAGTDTTLNFIGTTDGQPLIVKTENRPMIMVSRSDPNSWTGGGIGIGTLKPHPNYKLHINAHNNIDPAPSLIPGVTGGLLCTDEFSTRIANLSTGNDFDRPFFSVIKSNGSLTNPAAVTSNSRIGGLNAWAYDGTNSVGAGYVDWWVDGAVSTGAVPTMLLFGTSPALNGTSVKMSLRSNGNLNIGTGLDGSASNFRVQVHRDTSLLMGIVNTQSLSSSSGGFYHAYNSGTPAAAQVRLGGLMMGTHQSGFTFRNAASIAAFSEGAFSNGTSHPTYLALATTASGSNTPSERMRISAAGNVGIGTQNPQQLLHVVNTATCCEGILFESNYEALGIKSNIPNGFAGMHVYNHNGTRMAAFGGRNRDNQAYIVADSGDFAIWTGIPTQTRMVVTFNGRVGIGTGLPAAKLQVAGTGIFNDTLTATTMANTDSSNRVATTAWVKRQGLAAFAGTMANGVFPLNASDISGRIIPRIGSTASGNTITPNALTQDVFKVTALAVNATIDAPVGTFTDGQKIILRIKDNGTSRTLTWNAIYRAGNQFALPANTEAGKIMYLTFMWNGDDSKLDFVSLSSGY